MPSFEIPDSPAQLELRNQAVNGKPYRVATTTFTVTNKTAQALSGRFKVTPQGDAKADWLQLEGEKERPFGPSETQKVNVNVSLPGDVPAGEYKFRLVAMNVNDPGNDFTESAVVTFSPPKAVTPTPHAPIWPYIAAGVALLLIVGGVVAYLLWPSGVKVTDVVGQPAAKATAALEAQGLVVKTTDDHTPGKTIGTVVTETPAAGSSVDPKSTVTIAVAAATGPHLIDMPNVVTNPAMTFDAAHQKLVDAGFTNVAAAPVTGPAATGADPGKVIDTDPKLPAKVEANQPIKLIVDPGVPIPNNLIGTSIANVGDQLSPFSARVNLLWDNGTTNIIAGFTPPTGPLALHAPLTVNVHSPGCPFPQRWRCWRAGSLGDFKVKVLNNGNNMIINQP
jgi:serine/threonine-protein kinase